MNKSIEIILDENDLCNCKTEIYKEEYYTSRENILFSIKVITQNHIILDFSVQGNIKNPEYYDVFLSSIKMGEYYFPGVDCRIVRNSFFNELIAKLKNEFTFSENYKRLVMLMEFAKEESLNKNKGK